MKRLKVFLNVTITRFDEPRGKLGIIYGPKFILDFLLISIMTVFT